MFFCAHFIHLQIWASQFNHTNAHKTAISGCWKSNSSHKIVIYWPSCWSKAVWLMTGSREGSGIGNRTRVAVRLSAPTIILIYNIKAVYTPYISNEIWNFTYQSSVHANFMHEDTFVLKPMLLPCLVCCHFENMEVRMRFKSYCNK